MGWNHQLDDLNVFNFEKNDMMWFVLLLMVQKSGVHQLRLVVEFPLFTMVLYMPGGCYGFQHEKRFVALQLSVPGPVFNATSDRAPAIFLSFLGCAILSDERIRNLVAEEGCVPSYKVVK